MKNFNWKKINSNLTYTPEQLAKAISAHPKTIYRMIDAGLATVPGGANPYYIRGSDAKRFLRKRAKRNKKEIEHKDEMRCFTCRTIQMAIPNSIREYKTKNYKTGICSHCKNKMYKFF